MDTNQAMFCFRDNSLFSSVMDYLSIEKGWFSPYLFASGRRPVIPRSRYYFILTFSAVDDREAPVYGDQPFNVCT